MLKLLLNKQFEIDAIPIACAMAEGNVLITLRAANGNQFEVSFTVHPATPSKSTFEVRKQFNATPTHT